MTTAIRAKLVKVTGWLVKKLWSSWSLGNEQDFRAVGRERVIPGD